MKREQVYKAIDSEREYQDTTTADDKVVRMIAPFNLGQGMLAMDVILSKAKGIWYNDYPPYTDTMEYLRKIAGVCVMMGEKYGMKDR